ncbi:hypothetical protein J3Q64DRAFT_1832345 [Phycomyces blakesleeanus]|uniref:Uncharacterized protein n=2 Tax=Phycomyces blakesleeanus TaxID=4837 RepID=A0A162NHH9_PHYB8|nr:hypothetical protein PHYBLDRAFT_144755 [Phycomyces blakesleeanus NRRL 1555(-)]OAD74308.1 hypothetical protein PHYBLDRAFT_144755 [Phycomyces blakesleeanus NRRL 1555(-)]|eukprot:XP_018292348.1 hypothetical protein PHYBLDRAFT_144755 [Phycomyces blakesleeanus NRRL 1555(-)]
MKPGLSEVTIRTKKNGIEDQMSVEESLSGCGFLGDGDIGRGGHRRLTSGWARSSGGFRAFAIGSSQWNGHGDLQANALKMAYLMTAVTGADFFWAFSTVFNNMTHILARLAMHTHLILSGNECGCVIQIISDVMGQEFQCVVGVWRLSNVVCKTGTETSVVSRENNIRKLSKIQLEELRSGKNGRDGVDRLIQNSEALWQDRRAEISRSKNYFDRDDRVLGRSDDNKNLVISKQGVGYCIEGIQSV